MFLLGTKPSLSQSLLVTILPLADDLLKIKACFLQSGVDSLDIAE